MSAATARCDLSRSIDVDGSDLTISLTRPHPDLLYELALPLASVVRSTTPVEEVPGVPATARTRSSRAATDGLEIDPRARRAPVRRPSSRAAESERTPTPIARAMIADAGAGTEVTVLVPDPPDVLGAVDVMRYVTGVLDDVVFRATMRTVDGERCHATVFGGRPGYCDPTLDAAMDHAKALEATDPGAATREWTGIEHRLVDDAVQAPLSNQVATFPVSARTGNVQVHIQWGVLLSRLWVQ